MTFASGVINLVLGAVYLGLGVLAVWEVAVERHVLGLSRFGLAFAAMAATCGPHHLLHGWAAVRSGHDTPEVMVASPLGKLLSSTLAIETPSTINSSVLLAHTASTL